VVVGLDKWLQARLVLGLDKWLQARLVLGFLLQW
jgi:hypothetical protein